jgi:L-aspartate oxidase
MISTGDGIAIAYRAGALIVDMEFIQFHPTTLYSPGAPQFLLSEAMRGEGAILKNINGKRFMPEYHEMLELASRDTVTRAIVSEMVKTKSRHVYLDFTHLDKSFARNRFPQIYATCLQYDIDITEDMIPVCPAAHYIMGGVNTNFHGETSIKGLFAAGEVACTGVHGANRLASNSLLEGLVFGARAGKKAASYINEGNVDTIIAESGHRQVSDNKSTSSTFFDTEKVRSSLRQIMWNKVGIIRCEKSLIPTISWLNRWNFIMETSYQNRREAELKNMLTVAHLITDSAILRKGSVGAHYRSDFKERGENWQRHVACQKGKEAYWTDSKQE